MFFSYHETQISTSPTVEEKEKEGQTLDVSSLSWADE